MAAPFRSCFGGAARALAFGGLGLGFAQCAQAQTPPAPARPVSVEELERKIEQRDAVIDQLMRRVEHLEREVGARQAAGAPPAATTPGAAAPRSTVVATPIPPGTAAPAAAPPPSGPSLFEVSEKDVERALERALVQTGVLLLPPRAVEVVPSFSYLRRETTAITAVPGAGGATFLAEDKGKGNEYAPALTIRAGLPWESQIEVGIPYRFQSLENQRRLLPAAFSSQSAHTSGFGTLHLGLTKALFAESAWRPSVFASLQGDIPLGHPRDLFSVGRGFYQLTGGFTAAKRQDPLVFTAGAFYTVPFERDRIRPGNQVSFSLGTLLAVTPETSLRLGLDQTFSANVELNGRDIPGSDQSVGVISTGLSTVLGRSTLLDLVVGAGLTEDAPKYFVVVSLPIRFDY